MKLNKRLLLGGFLVVAALLALDAQAPQLALAQQKGKGGGFGAPSSKTDPKFLALFKDSVAPAARSTFRVQCDGKDTALGVAVSADGYILTKASDLTGKVTIKTAEGIILEAKIVGKHEGHDLAMLKVEAWGFVPVQWADSSSIAPVGHFVVSVGTGATPVAVGVVSVAARTVPPTKGPAPKGPNPGNVGYLGVSFVDSAKGVVLTTVQPKTPAEAAKLKTNDILLVAGDQAIKTIDEFTSVLSKHKPGDTLTLKVLRGEEELELKATLGKQPAANNNRGDVQNNMGSRLSNRRAGFPFILQHDSVVLPEDCGGPLVDLDGRVLGINIARAGRVESYTIPAETIRPLLQELMGKQSVQKQ